MSSTRRPCSHTTAKGQPCRAWAMAGTEPPTCAAHAKRPGHGGQPGNQNARKHGFYSSVLQPRELADLLACSDNLSLDDEIACARVTLRRILTMLNNDHNHKEALSAADHARLAGLALQATRTVARLLRDKRALSRDAADTLSEAIGFALDELGRLLGRPL